MIDTSVQCGHKYSRSLEARRRPVLLTDCRQKESYIQSRLGATPSQQRGHKKYFVNTVYIFITIIIVNITIIITIIIIIININSIICNNGG